jgi:trk system potassium uptake protein TrkA
MKPISYIVIIGSGKIGSFMANKLSHLGHSVTIIDIEEKAFSRLDENCGGFTIKGDGVDPNTLKKAKLYDADYLICTSDDDNANLMIAQLARKYYNTPRVIAHVFDPKWEDLYHHFEIEILSSVSTISGLFIQEMFKEDV